MVTRYMVVDVDVDVCFCFVSLLYFTSGNADAAVPGARGASV